MLHKNVSGKKGRMNDKQHDSKDFTEGTRGHPAPSRPSLWALEPGPSLTWLQLKPEGEHVGAMRVAFPPACHCALPPGTPGAHLPMTLMSKPGWHQGSGGQQMPLEEGNLSARLCEACLRMEQQWGSHLQEQTPSGCSPQPRPQTHLQPRAGSGPSIRTQRAWRQDR